MLPGIGDDQTLFSPGRAFVRRVNGFNIWLLYRFDEENVFVMTARGEPTDLPEGREVELVAPDDEEFDPEEKVRLLKAIEDGDIEKGDHMDGFEFIAQLRAKREAASQ